MLDYAIMLITFPKEYMIANVTTVFFPVQKVMKLTIANSQPRRDKFAHREKHTQRETHEPTGDSLFESKAFAHAVVLFSQQLIFDVRHLYLLIFLVRFYFHSKFTLKFLKNCRN